MGVAHKLNAELPSGNAVRGIKAMTGFGRPDCVPTASPSLGKSFTMYSQRQTAHLNELHLLRNYASGRLRQELDDEIEGLRHQTASFLQSRGALEGKTRYWSSRMAEMGTTTN